MPRLPNPKTKEGRVITEGINHSDYTQAKLAEELDVTPGFVSQFATGHRPVPWNKAEELAARIRRKPEEISEEYRKIKTHFEKVLNEAPNEKNTKANPTPAEIEAGKRLHAQWNERAFFSNLTQKEIAEILDSTQGLVTQYLTQRIPLDYETLSLFSRVLNTAPEIIRGTSQKQGVMEPQGVMGSYTSNENSWADVRTYSQQMGLGTTGPEIAENVDIHTVKFRRDSLNKHNLIPNNLVIMHGAGDSMLPYIQSGDAIMFDVSDTTPHHRHIYVIITPGASNDEYNVKRCIIDYKHSKRVFFAADNPEGDHDWQLPRWKDDPNYPIKIIGRVRWVCRWVE
ncbi:hypothetical protein B9J09_04230 [Xylella fastidiosa subsp. pauca]|uniref:XRE family transcriptional regulator n=1 Tax=Xylella fastidiosa TaxID=2371 RepID=UPI00069BD581|nr:XRE family transcriptional regulator [Xylella fastidiosa]ARO68355.1 hypothetical protein B9J09_04230 [Xylella fastidiosa subsp. pauca]AVI22510.1 hypothetical protein BC375_04020 [Xylella fastidiosa]KXB09838.1 hypothetical protein ADT32_11525 [Xylella fastidiosa]KXB14212.1 hypothetical protein ADT31_09520 [Xylella fastidiosa]KXB16034.1 hypothetical protein ADT33_04050 [Xylella fastidiosa]